MHFIFIYISRALTVKYLLFTTEYLFEMIEQKYKFIVIGYSDIFKLLLLLLLLFLNYNKKEHFQLDDFCFDLI